MNGLEHVLKNEVLNARITVGNKWLVWGNKNWEVYEHNYHKKNSECLISTEHLNIAIELLLKE